MPYATLAQCELYYEAEGHGPPVLRVVETIGFTPTLQFVADGARFFDTFGLLTQVLLAQGQHFIFSSKTVNHFTQASYVPEHRGAKDRDCMLMLEDLRAGRGMARENFVLRRV